MIINKIKFYDGLLVCVSPIKSNPAVETDEAHWTWTPVKHRGSLDIKTATFSGKNQADDYTNE